MTVRTQARDLMLASFPKLNDEATLREAIEILISAQQDTTVPNCAVVTNSNGRYEGLITAHLVIKSLLSLWSPAKEIREDEGRLESELLEIVHDRSQLRVRDALVRGLPTARPESGVLTLIDMACDKQLEFVPVVVDETCQGVVPVTKIFHAAASLALTPDDEGIRMDGKTFT